MKLQTCSVYASVIAAMGLAYGSEAAAQTGASVDTAAVQSTNDAGLEEVMVTARRRDEPLQKVPITITALGTEELQARSITTQTDLQSAVPGLTVRQTNYSNSLNYSIRGQSVDAFSTSSPGVLPYFNDVNVNTGGTTLIYDLGSLQVLKGPQGTLFGRNTTGGAVLFNTRAPGDTFGGYVTARLGDYDLREIVAAVDLPIVADKMLVRIAGDTRRRDGYVTNLYDGTKLGKDERDSIRATVLLRPFEGFENSTVFQYNDAGGNNQVGGPYSVNGPNGVVYSVDAPGGRPTGQALSTSVYTFYTPAIGAVPWAAYVAAHPGVDPLGIVHFLQQQSDLGPYHVSQDDPNSHWGRDYLLTNTTTYDFTEHTRLKNIVGYVSSKSHDVYDEDGSPFGIFTFRTPDGQGLHYDRRQWSDELQLSGELFGEQLSYVAGVYAASERIRLLSFFAAFDLLPLAPASVFDHFFESQDTQWAGYAQTAYKLDELTGINGLTVNAGFRWTHDKFELKQIAAAPGVFGLGYGAPDESVSESKPSWSVGLDYQVNDGLLLYLTQRGSWRTGGLSGQAPAVRATIAEGGNLYFPETTVDVEVGAKYRGDLLGAPMTFNVAAYTQRVKNVQRVVYAVIDGALNALTANIPEAKISGFEVDGMVNLTRWLQVGVNVAETRAKYTDGHVSYTALGVDLDYGPYADTPRWTGTAFVQLHTPLQYVGEAVLRVDQYAQSHFYFSNLGATVNPGARIPGYSLTNLRLELNDINHSQASIAVFVRNLFDKAYYTGGLATGNSAGINIINVGEPRMMGVELNYKF